MFVHHQHQNQQSQNFLGSHIDIGTMNNFPYLNPYSIKDSTAGTLPLFPVPSPPPLYASKPHDSLNWVYALPGFHILDSLSKKNLPSGTLENLAQEAIFNRCPTPVRKRFLVFDQSGGKTNLICCSQVETAARGVACQNQKPPATYDLKERSNIISTMWPIGSGKCDESYYRYGSESDMRENTAELDALLYSDSDSDCSEDEEMSTAHSPSTMTNIGKVEPIEEILEEIVSSTGPSKRQKLSDGGYAVQSSLKTYNCPELEDDAQSSCGNVSNQEVEEFCPSYGKKRAWKVTIQKKVSVLQSIIPGTKGKNATGVIDEAIDFLRSLKVEAKALGLDTL